MYILMEHSNSIGVDYDRSDTQGEMGFIFCGKHSLLMTRIQMSDQRPKGPLV